MLISFTGYSDFNKKIYINRTYHLNDQFINGEGEVYFLPTGSRGTTLSESQCTFALAIC